MGVPRCSSCKVTQSPEWRKGPSGKKDLCNACGLRYARSRAKKEGGPSQQSRRRKDRVFNSMQKDHSPSGSPGPSGYQTLPRRGSYYDDASFGSASSNGSPGAPDLYAPTAHAGPSFKGPMSPSPSPSPGGGMQHHPHQPYMPYPHPHQGTPHPLMHAPQNAHADAPGRYSNSFYSVPPPAPPHPHSHQQPSLHHMSSHSSLHSNGSYSQSLAGPGQPPRLDPIVPVSYGAGGRMSPSPIGGSPLSTSFSSASYERERPMKMQEDREELPPSPVSADPRNRRSPYK